MAGFLERDGFCGNAGPSPSPSPPTIVRDFFAGVFFFPDGVAKAPLTSGCTSVAPTEFTTVCSGFDGISGAATVFFFFLDTAGAAPTIWTTSSPVDECAIVSAVSPVGSNGVVGLDDPPLDLDFDLDLAGADAAPEDSVAAVAAGFDGFLAAGFELYAK